MSSCNSKGSGSQNKKGSILRGTSRPESTCRQVPASRQCSSSTVQPEPLIPSIQVCPNKQGSLASRSQGPASKQGSQTSRSQGPASKQGSQTSRSQGPASKQGSLISKCQGRASKQASITTAEPGSSISSCQRCPNIQGSLTSRSQGPGSKQESLISRSQGPAGKQGSATSRSQGPASKQGSQTSRSQGLASKKESIISRQGPASKQGSISRRILIQTESSEVSMTRAQSKTVMKTTSGMRLIAKEKVATSTIKKLPTNSDGGSVKYSRSAGPSGVAKIRMSSTSSANDPDANLQITKVKVVGAGLQPTGTKQKCKEDCSNVKTEPVLAPLTEEEERGKPVPPGMYYIPIASGGAVQGLNVEEAKLRQKLQKYTPTSLSHWKVENTNPFAKKPGPLRAQHPDIISGVFRSDHGIYESDSPNPRLEQRLDPSLPEQHWSMSLREAMSLQSGQYEQNIDDEEKDTIEVVNTLIERQLNAKLPSGNMGSPHEQQSTFCACGPNGPCDSKNIPAITVQQATPVSSPGTVDGGSQTQRVEKSVSQPQNVQGDGSQQQNVQTPLLKPTRSADSLRNIDHQEFGHTIQSSEVKAPRMQSPVGEIDAQNTIYINRITQSSPRGTTVDTAVRGTKLISPGQAKQIDLVKHDRIPPSSRQYATRRPQTPPIEYVMQPRTPSQPINFSMQGNVGSPEYSLLAERGSPVQSPSPVRKRSPVNMQSSITTQRGSPARFPSPLRELSMRDSPQMRPSTPQGSPCRLQSQTSPYRPQSQGSPYSSQRSYTPQELPSRMGYSSEKTRQYSPEINIQPPAPAQQYPPSPAQQYPPSPARRFSPEIIIQPSTPTQQYPPSLSSEQDRRFTPDIIIQPPSPTQQYPPSPTEQYPPSSTQQYPPSSTQQYPSSPTQQYPSSPTQQYPSSPTQQYPPSPTQQYPPSPTQQYPPSPTEQYPPSSTQQYSPSPTQQYPPSPTEQFPPSHSSEQVRRFPPDINIQPPTPTQQYTPSHSAGVPIPPKKLPPTSAQTPSISPGRKSTMRVSPVRLEPAAPVPSPEEVTLDLVRRLVDEERQDVVLSLELPPPLSNKLNKLKKKPQSMRLLEETMDQNVPMDEDSETFKSDLLADLMYSQETGTINPACSPKKIYDTLFPSLLDEQAIRVSPAAPAPLHDIVVPVGEATADSVAVITDELQEAAAGEDVIPKGNAFAETVSEEHILGPNLRKKIFKEKPKSDEDTADYIPRGELDEQKAPWDIDVGSLEDLVGGKMSMMSEWDNLPSDESVRATAGRLEYVLDVKPMHYSCVQLRGSQLPGWFPGYYNVLPQVDGFVRLERSPSRAFAAAWHVFAPYQAAEQSEVVYL